ncbi:hypothetical protein AX16_007736 [Volvariella volvacea WC 439]|nr:hypothetical protein AX16_007736 [Volvariella volvacea WC 439]
MRVHTLSFVLSALLYPLSLSPSFALALPSFAALNPSSPVHIIHEKRDKLPHGWIRLKKHNPASPLQLRIALRQSNLDLLDQYLLNVSHPDSPHYGKHWSARKVAETFAPSQESVEGVKMWLMGSGFRGREVVVSKSGGWISVNTTVETAERLLRTEYHVYAHKTGQRHVGAESYSVPEDIAEHIDFITPSVHFDVVIKPQPQARASRPPQRLGYKASPKTSNLTDNKLFNDLKDCHQQITPACLQALYGFLYDPISPKRNSFGIVEYTPQSYIQSDLDLFASHFSPNLVGKSPTLVSIDGGLVIPEPNFDLNVESNLDLEYAMSLVGDKQEVKLYQIGDPYEGASFNNLLDALDGPFCSFDGGNDPIIDGNYPDDSLGGYTGDTDCGTVSPTNVIATSYGYNEVDLTYSYVRRQCNEYAKLGLMGITFLYASGDFGVAGHGNLCLREDGMQTKDGTIFSPSFPATCPYVTSIGATQINPDHSVTDRESACERTIYSGGGFSNYFDAPAYQGKVVEKYVKEYGPKYEGTKWNASGRSRGFPDLAANGADYAVAVNGTFMSVYGTSASTPVIGAILTMINDARITLGKSPIGFINPAIYSTKFKGAFNDIVSGKNPGCGTDGFSAAPGWDPVTGLGTPWFPELLARWLQLP